MNASKRDGIRELSLEEKYVVILLALLHTLRGKDSSEGPSPVIKLVPAARTCQSGGGGEERLKNEAVAMLRTKPQKAETDVALKLTSTRAYIFAVLSFLCRGPV